MRLNIIFKMNLIMDIDISFEFDQTVDIWTDGLLDNGVYFLPPSIDEDEDEPDYLDDPSPYDYYEAAKRGNKLR